MKLDGLLKSKKMKIAALGGEEVEVFELPYGAQMAIHKSTLAEDGMEGAITVKYALKLDEQLQVIADSIPLALVQEITDKLTDSGLMSITGDEEAVKN